jgi:deoxyribodipyrimidine photolyase-like uncharacterized protein
VTARRWLFGDQLGPHFLDEPGERVLLIESRAVFARRRFHRQKAHLVLSAMRHRAAELGDRCRYVRADTYREVVGSTRDRLSVCHPTSHAALDFVRGLDVDVLDARGFSTSMSDFTAWADGRGDKRLLMEDFYRDARHRLDVLMDGTDPAGGRWNFDKDNREPPPKQPRTRSTTRSVATSTGGSGTGSSSWARTDPGASPPPAPRRGTPCATSSSTGCRSSGRTRTRCCRPTRGWRTRCCRPR